MAARWKFVAQVSEWVRIERGGKYDNYRVMVNRRNGDGWVRADTYGFDSDVGALQFAARFDPKEDA